MWEPSIYTWAFVAPLGLLLLLWLIDDIWH